MSGDGRGDESAPVTARLPGPLWERIKALFQAERGYEPSTAQEALGVICDLAEQDEGSTGERPTDHHQPQTDLITVPEGSTDQPETESSVGSGSLSLPPASPEKDGSDSPTPQGETKPTSPSEPAGAIGTAPQSVVDVVDAVFPDGWDDDAFGRRFLPAVVDEYAACVTDRTSDPEHAAIEAVADRSGIAPDRLREQLIARVYSDEPLPDEIAADFFSEALEVAEDRLRNYSDDTDEPVVVELAEHGGLSPNTTFEGTQMEPPNELAAKDEVSFDDLVDDLDATSDPVVPDATNVESLLETSHADSRVREVAGEVLDEMTGDLFDELENGVDQGTGAGVADGQGGTATTDERGGSTATASPDDQQEAEESESGSIPGPLRANPETDCDECGANYRVSDLETGLNDDGMAVLLCPDCR